MCVNYTTVCPAIKYWLCGPECFSLNNYYYLLPHGVMGMKSLQLAGTASLNNSSTI